MTFLEPLLLALGLAAGVPLLLHLMRRRLGTRIEFPAARYLARAEQEHSRKLKLRNLLLMLLRVLVILLIAAAAARPVGRLAGTGHPPTALALVLDNSLSTSAVVAGEPVLEALKTVARRALERATVDDQLWLLTADGRVQGGARAALLEAVEQVAALAGGGDLPAALARAASLAAAAELPARQVLLVTDGQATGWPGEPDRLGVPVTAYLPPEPPPANRSVAAASARPVRFTPRGAVVAQVAGADSAAYTLTVGGQTVARGSAHAGEEIVVRAAPAGQGWTAGLVEIPPDELRGDDRRHFALWLGEPPAVRVDASAGAFVPSAVAALVQSGRAAQGTAAVIVAADAADRLPALLVAPADPVRLGAANRNLERLGVPWRFGPPRRAQTDVRGERLEGVTATLRYPLLPRGQAAADTLATAGGDAWVMAGDGYVLVASPLDPSATALPLSAAFVPWLGDLIAQRLAAAPGVALTAAPGARIAVPAYITGWEAPGGGQQLIVDGALTAPADPGVYFLLRGPARAGALAVNPEPQESVLERLSPPALRARLGVRDVEVTANQDRFVAAAFDPAAGRSLIAPLLVAALLALAAEAWLSRRGTGGHT